MIIVIEQLFNTNFKSMIIVIEQNFISNFKLSKLTSMGGGNSHDNHSPKCHHASMEEHM